MTHSGGKPHEVGDRGQRFEVSYQSAYAFRRDVFGWADTPEGALRMAESISLNPSMTNPQIKDRQA